MFLVKTKPSPVIVIDDGSSGRSFYRINQRLTRLGSAPRSDLRFPESTMASHFATIEWKDGLILIHNRSGYHLSLGEVAVEPNSIAIWPDGVTLLMNDNLRLTLAQDPRSRAAQSNPLGGVVETQIASDQESSELFSTKTIVLGAILILCCALLLFDSSVKAENADHKTFEKLALQAYEPGTEGPLKQEIISQLQMADRARFRFGDKDLKVYTNLRDYIRALENKNGRLPDRWFEEIHDYLLKRIERATN
jgi:hypothetical protein